MYTTKEAAAIFKVNIETIKRHIRSGDIEAVKVGRGWRISEQEIERIKKEGYKRKGE